MPSIQATPQALHQWVDALWLAAGSCPDEARLTADHLIGANLAGHDSHGIGMVPRYVKSWAQGALQLNRTLRTVHQAGSLLTLDAQCGMGPNMAYQAMQLAIAQAKKDGVCVMGLRNSHHLGRVGHWAEQAVAHGLVSIHFTNAVSGPPSVAPHGGKQARFITNPFTVGIPRGHEAPIVLDFATSAIAHGKARVAYNKKMDVPPSSLIDAQGQNTNNPAVLFEADQGQTGALLPFGGHKGYALSMVCELLGAALIGGPTTRPEHLMAIEWAVWNNMLTIVFDPNHLAGEQYASAFENEARQFIEWVKSSPLRAGFDAIHMPGEPERASRVTRANLIEVDAGTVDQLNEAQAIVQQRSGQTLKSLL
jgi:hydroxycarboxylate dehydrogenase B